MQRENDSGHHDGKADAQVFTPKPYCSYPPLSYDDIVVAEDVKRQLEELFTAPWEGKPSEGLVLLSGPPGTGKTRIARALPAHFGIPLFQVDPVELFMGYFDEIEKDHIALMRGVRRYAEEHGTDVMLLFDGLDAWRTSLPILLESLHELDGSQQKFILLALTNAEEMLDGELMKKFRRIRMPLPDFAARRELLERELRSKAVGEDILAQCDLDEAARLADGLSGRAIVMAVTRFIEDIILWECERKEPEGSWNDTLLRRISEVK